MGSSSNLLEAYTPMEEMSMLHVSETSKFKKNDNEFQDFLGIPLLQPDWFEKEITVDTKSDK